VLPPSRGRLKAGAFTPSAKGIGGAVDNGDGAAARWAGGDAIFSAAGFFTGEASDAGLVAATFDIVVVRAADFAGEADFNFFDGALWEAFAAALPGCLFFVLLPDLVAVVLRVFEVAVLADFADWGRAAFLAAGFGVFLRVFLDIRLPFVAFRGSIIEVLRQAGIEQTIR
jgi:hypothetical protein